MGEMLSEHFSVYEFEYSITAITKGIKNTMNEAEKKVAKHTCVYLLENIRKQLNEKYTKKDNTVKCVILNITSGFRNDAVNTAVGGVNKPGKVSQHRKAEAADIKAVIVYKNGARKTIPYNQLYNDIKELTKAKKLYIDQCIQEASYNKRTQTWSYWVHCSLGQQISKRRGEFLKFNNGVYTLDCIIK